MADSAKDLMAQNLGGSGDKDNKDTSASGGTVPPASDESDEQNGDTDDQDETDTDEDADDDLPEGSKTAVIPPEQDSFGSLDDEAKGKADGSKTVNLRDGPGDGKQGDAASGGSGDSGGSKPPAPRSGGDGGNGDEGGDGKPVNEILAAMMLVKEKLGILVPAHEKANQMQDTIGVLLQRLKMYEANPPSDVDLTALKALVATIAALVDAGHSRIDAAHKRPELDAALAYLKG